MKQLIGHTSQETAYVVADYPYGFRLRTSIRYWIETKNKFGQRFCSQTLNPKNGKRNKPKCSAYLAVAVLVLDDVGHVACPGLSYYDDEPTWRAFKETYELDAWQLVTVDNAIRVKTAYTAKAAELGEGASYEDILKACVLDDLAAAKGRHCEDI